MSTIWVLCMYVCTDVGINLYQQRGRPSVMVMKRHIPFGLESCPTCRHSARADSKGLAG